MLVSQSNLEVINIMKNMLKSNIETLAFKIARNTILKDAPEHFKDLAERAIINGHKTKEIPFRHVKIDGLIWPPFMTEEQLRICNTFPTNPNDVFLVTYPKTGTTWIAEIVRCITQKRNPNRDIPDMGMLRFEMANQEQLETWSSPRSISTHLPFDMVMRHSEHPVKYIYLARNPKDVAVSFFHFMRSDPLFDFNGTWSEFLQHFMKGDIFYGSYFDHISAWWSHKDDENVLFLKYEDLKQDLQSQVQIIAEFLGFEFSEEEARSVKEQCTFQAMKSNPKLNINKLPKSKSLLKKSSHLRKGIVGDWKNHFSEEQLAEFDRVYQSRLKGTGLDFEH